MIEWEWENTVLAAIEEQEMAMDESVKSGVFHEHETKVTSYLNLVDQAAMYADKQLDKQIVTTEDTCTALVDAMERTAPELTLALNDIRWPTGDIPQDTEAESDAE